MKIYKSSVNIMEKYTSSAYPGKVAGVILQ